MDNDFFSSLSNNPLLAINIGIYIEKYSGIMVLQAIANERAALAQIFENLANEHAVIDDEQNVVTAMVYRDVAEKVRSRG